MHSFLTVMLQEKAYHCKVVLSILVKFLKKPRPPLSSQETTGHCIHTSQETTGHCIHAELYLQSRLLCSSHRRASRTQQQVKEGHF